MIFSYIILQLSKFNTNVISQAALVVKKLPANTGDVRDKGSIPGLARSPRGGHGNPFQCSCLEDPWTEEPGGLKPWCYKELDIAEVT